MEFDENMKAITEERLRELIYSGEFSNLIRERNLLVRLLSHVEEIDTLTVSKLRPMEDAQEDDEVLVKVLGDSKLKAASVFEGKFIDNLCDEIDKRTIEGIAQMPIYKPEKE